MQSEERKKKKEIKSKFHGIIAYNIIYFLMKLIAKHEWSDIYYTMIDGLSEWRSAL